jgi:hypothetical protein
VVGRVENIELVWVFFADGGSAFRARDASRFQILRLQEKNA